MNSPARVSRRNAPSWLPPLAKTRRRASLRGGFPLGGCDLSTAGFRLFSRPFLVSFQLSLTLLVHYRSPDVFSLGSKFSRFESNIRCPLVRIPVLVGGFLSPTGLSPSMAPLSRRTLGRETRHWNRSTTPHFALISKCDSVWTVPRSLAVTRGIASCFLFLRLLECFRSARSLALLPAKSFWDLAGFPFGDLRIVGMHAPPRSLWQLATPFFGAGAKSSTSRVLACWVY